MEGLTDINTHSLDFVLRMEIQEQLKEISTNIAKIDAKFEEKFKIFDNDLKGVRQGVNNLQTAQSRIENYLHNDPATGQEGLVKKVDIHHNVFNEIKTKEVFERIDKVEERVDKIEENEKIEKGKKALLNTIFGVIGGGIVWLIKVFLT